MTKTFKEEMNALDIPAGSYMVAGMQIDTYNTLPSVSLRNHEMEDFEMLPGEAALIVSPIQVSKKTFKFLFNEKVYEETPRWFLSAAPWLIVHPSAALIGKKVCFTGPLSITRPVYEKMIELQSGKLSTSVTKNTDFLVTEEPKNMSTKLVAAKNLGIPILSEQQFLGLCKAQRFLKNRF